LAVVVALTVAAGGQSGTVLRTPWGDPDLQGVWNFATTTPLERPAGVTKAVLSDAEYARVQKQVAQGLNADKAPAVGETGTYNEHWFERGPLLRQTSLVVDPPDGQIPPYTAEGQQRMAAQVEALRHRGEFDSWLDRPLPDRCLLQLGVPPLPVGYNSNYQILQTPDYVAIRQEMLPETRLVPLDGRPHLGASIRTWMGDPRGHWEGETLVVESTNFNGWGGGLYAYYQVGSTRLRSALVDLQGDTSRLKIVERFTRAGPDAIDYRATVEDPAMFTRAWTMAMPFRRAPGPIYEYACHEGNAAMEHMLSGARAQERLEKGSR
jgi:hypothetical protein